MSNTRESAPRSAGRALYSLVKEVLIVIIGAMIVSSLLRAFVFEPFTIPSGSMENTLQIQDKVIAQKVTDFKRGDVIVFRDPGSWVTSDHGEPRGPVGQVLEFVGVLPNSSDDFLTKRVIGMPGDKVKCCDAQQRLTINGTPINESGYLYSSDNEMVNPSDMPFEVTVPLGRVFVMGDHRNASADSRCHLHDQVPGFPEGANAFVPIDNVVGPIGLIVAPYSRWQQLRTPPAFEWVPPPASPAPQQAEISANFRC